jgi:hypothetical protein
MSTILVRTVDRYGILEKVKNNCFCMDINIIIYTTQAGWFTADGASNNDTSLKFFGAKIDPFKSRWDPVQRRIMSVYLVKAWCE